MTTSARDEREGRRPATVAYVHYGPQSGVTVHVTSALERRGWRVVGVSATGGLEPRDPSTRRWRLTPGVVRHLFHAGVAFGPRALAHRWNTCFAFDRHSVAAGAALDALPVAPDVILQNGALFSPGIPPRGPHVLLLDHTRALAGRSTAAPGMRPLPDYGPGWHERERRLYQGAAEIAVFSRHVAESLRRDYGVDPGRIHVVGAGANVFPPTVERQDDGETVLFVGKDFRRKGGFVLLEAFRELLRERPRARLLVAGPPLGTLPELPPRVEHVGPVPFSDLPSLFARATVFAMPSLREPFGIAFLDAMACGLPCVGTEVGAIPEIIDGDVGLRVPPGDAQALAVALASLLSDPARARAMGARGRERVRTGCRWPHVGDRLDRVLVLAARRGGHLRELSAPAAP